MLALCPMCGMSIILKTYAGLIGSGLLQILHSHAPALSPQPGKISDAMATRPTVVTVRLINLFLLLKQ